MDNPEILYVIVRFDVLRLTQSVTVRWKYEKSSEN
jgi:hypothetical protein